jgi:AcrR family transcriptional regulator
MNAQTMTHAAPGRPRQFDENKALAAIMRLFWEHGYEATGLNDIIRVTGLGKASLYATFGNKQSMYLRALAAFEADMIDEGAHILQSGDAPPIERIAAFLDAPIAALRDTGDARGCFLCNASADRAALDAETAAVVQRCYAKLASALEQTLAGIVAPELTQRRAQMLLAVASGLRVMARTGMPIPTLEQARDDALSILRES